MDICVFNFLRYGTSAWFFGVVARQAVAEYLQQRELGTLGPLRDGEPRNNNSI